VARKRAENFIAKLPKEDVAQLVRMAAASTGLPVDQLQAAASHAILLGLCFRKKLGSDYQESIQHLSAKLASFRDELAREILRDQTTLAKHRWRAWSIINQFYDSVRNPLQRAQYWAVFDDLVHEVGNDLQAFTNKLASILPRHKKSREVDSPSDEFELAPDPQTEEVLDGEQVLNSSRDAVNKMLDRLAAHLEQLKLLLDGCDEDMRLALKPWVTRASKRSRKVNNSEKRSVSGHGEGI
jgi:hypothetical protein